MADVQALVSAVASLDCVSVLFQLESQDIQVWCNWNIQGVQKGVRISSLLGIFLMTVNQMMFCKLLGNCGHKNS